MKSMACSHQELLITALLSGVAGAFLMHLVSGARSKWSMSRFIPYLSSPAAAQRRRRRQRQHDDGSEATSDRDPFDPSKRTGYLSWDDYFMAIAFLTAQRSKDPNRQVGACLVSQTGVILGIGYNGFPRGCSDDVLPWAKKSKTGDPLLTKYPYVCHAEVNAILNTNHASAAEQKLYVTMFPCNECAKIIIQAGVAEVIYFIDKVKNTTDPAYVASWKMLNMAGVKVRKHQPCNTTVEIHYD